MNEPTPQPGKPEALFERVQAIIESAKASVARSVNTAQVVSNWLIGREIVEDEQRGMTKAEYGKRLLAGLSARLTAAFGKGYSVDNLELARRFYSEYPVLISAAVRRKSSLPEKEAGPEILHEARGGAWKPGRLNPGLAWTHYRLLLKVRETAKRGFYEAETAKNGWSTRELERQMGSLLYERLALSRDKKGVMRLAVKGQEVQKPADVFKDPVVMEFLGLPASTKLVESDLEEALIGNLQRFLLEMGRGLALVARQERLTLDGDHFYIDLVFYHTVLKCFVIIDLKAGKLTHQDLGQLQLYVNYYDRERRGVGDNPTLGLILCADKNDAVVRYTLGRGQRKIFASRYKLHLPSEAELEAEVRRELRARGT